MLNYIWAGMILLGVIYGVCTGQMSALTEGALDSAGEAVSLCITMAGVMALWMGLMEIAQESGMITKMTKGIRPFLKFMFPRLPEDHPAGEYIATNLCLIYMQERKSSSKSCYSKFVFTCIISKTAFRFKIILPFYFYSPFRYSILFKLFSGEQHFHRSF